MYPGQFHSIKLNLFNVVLVLDLSRPASLNMITSAISGIISRGLPFRFGIVPLSESEDSACNSPTVIQSSPSGSLIPKDRREDGEAFLPLGAQLWPQAHDGFPAKGGLYYTACAAPAIDH